MYDVDERVERLDKLYKTSSTPVAVASTVGLNAIVYYASLPSNPLQLQLPGDVIELYSFTLFFIVLSVAIYAIGYVRSPLFCRYLAVFTILTSLVVPMTTAQAWAKLEDPWIIVIPLEIGFAYYASHRARKKKV